MGSTAANFDSESLRQIEGVVRRFCRGVDRHDRAILESCYHSDAEDDHGIYKGDAKGFIDWVLGATEGVTFMQHTVSNTMVLAGSGDVLAVETYYHVRTLGIDGGLAQAFGRYLDRFERRKGEWRVASRVTTMEFSTPNLGYDPANFDKGSPDRSDSSFALIASVG